MSDHRSSADDIKAQYARRASLSPWRYNLVNPSVWQAVQDRERAILSLWRRLGWHDLSARDVLEVGCGTGGNLLEMLRHGFDPGRMVAVELLEERCRVARERLPAAVHLHAGDALDLERPDGSFDVVLQSTVFSSVLDADLRRRLADRMWRWVRPGGGILWYDFVVDNPANRDVRAVPLSEVRALFPQATLSVRRVTLAPPLARAVSRVHPALYTLFNTVPLLRTHVLCWISKP